MSSYKAYLCLGELGKGSYGSVTKNRHTLTGDIVAIKCFLTETKEFSSVKKSVLAEVSALRELRHENTVRLFHIFMENATFYMVFEFVDKTLLDVIRDAPKKCLHSGSRTRSFSFQLFRALAFVHSHNFVHRDVKPENILITSNNILKLADFGFAVRQSYAGQRYSTYIATRWYRAPELLSGDIFYGKPVDVWAAGAVIVEMILGQPMAAGADDVDQMSKTIELVGDLPPYMSERLRRSEQAAKLFPLQHFDRYAGIENLLRGQPEAYISFIKFCLEPDPQFRTTSEALLQHPLFSNRETLIAEIRQNIVTNNRNAALSYQSFLRHKDPYFRAARDILHQNPGGTISQAALSRYRTLGLDEQVLRQMAEVIWRTRKYPPDFLSQSSDLYSFKLNDARGDHSRHKQNDVMSAVAAAFPQAGPGNQRGAPINQPKLGMYFQSAPTRKTSSGSSRREQSVPPPNLPANWRKMDVSPARTMPSNVSTGNPWNNFNVRKTFPVQEEVRNTRVQPKMAKRFSLNDARSPHANSDSSHDTNSFLARRTTLNVFHSGRRDGAAGVSVHNASLQTLQRQASQMGQLGAKFGTSYDASMRLRGNGDGSL